MEQETEISQSGPIRIDVGQILRARLGAHKVPGWAVRFLEKLIRQQDLNELLRYAWPRRGVSFCSAVIEHLNINLQVKNVQRLPKSQRAIFVSNHPLGGLDGMSLIHFIGRHYGCEPLFVVNDLLMAVEPLREVFLPINKHGAQSRQSYDGIEAAMASDRPVIIFPAGMCSRRRSGKIVDLQWRKMFVQKARAYGRDIVPLHFDARNSGRFYTFASLREKLGIKFNAEMILLPSELIKAKGSPFTISVGQPVLCQSLTSDLNAEVECLRQATYSMAPQ